MLSGLSKMDPKEVRLFFQQHPEFDFKSMNLEFLSELNEFPLETLLVLLKSGFPPIIDGDLFFLKSLNEFDTPLDFILDLCNRLHVNLNHINRSTGETILQEAIRNNNLSLVQKILSHRVDPNFGEIAPINLAWSLYQETQSSNYLLIIRHLYRYGAEVIYADVPEKFQKELDAGSKIPPIYYTSGSYLNLDQVEDLSLVLLQNPALISDLQMPGVNLQALENSLKYQRARVEKSSDGKLCTWPLYINDTLDMDLVCPPEKDDRPSAASPPDFREVYRRALEPLPEKKTEAYVLPTVQVSFPQRYDASIPQIELELMEPIRPLPGLPIMPSAQPKPPALR